MKLSPLGFEKFRLALALRESGNNYEIVNTLGFMGRYQFGKPRLFDFEISIDGYKPVSVPVLPARFKRMTKKEFLEDHALQDNVFERHVLELAERITIKFPYAIDKWSLSGLVAGAHLMGVGGLRKFIGGEVTADAYGTKISEYVGKFGFIEIVE